ncbi:MAG: thioredoxin domain-containing protein [Verrucomicrobia bacterium]|nr:MAG: thioredoxin domain-containing protein [Verrucomicrobiota bacterium]
MDNTITQPAHTNHLAHETSPYLLQHAHNPVDWYPWSTAALERARREDKPIFLSIGYSACHWCHVMERESFENQQTAELLNRHFVCIKVDREERPDLDEIYMTAVQMMTGSGGWPLSVFLTPDLKPIFGGTYFPPEARHGMASFRTVLESIANLWEKKRANLLANAEEVTRAVRAHAAAAGAGNGKLKAALPEVATKELLASFDRRWGGFGGAPKFPPTAALALLLQQYAQTKNPQLLQPVTFTLDAMAHGGIHDQLGGGFHRYVVDERWLVPHFEKMLYDNALLAGVYLDAWQVTGQPLYRHVVCTTCDYVLRDMTAPGGGFCSSQDADSEGHEGLFYIWTPAEIQKVLGADDTGLFCKFYDVTREGNFEGRNILHVSRDLETFARIEKLDAAEVEQRLAAIRAKLFAARTQRISPGLDDKVLTSWNALMISTLARAARTLDILRYRLAAEQAAAFILTTMRVEGRLLHTSRAGQARQPAFLDDYALLCNALLDLYETTQDARRLATAEELAEQMVALFHDEKAGGFFMTSSEHTDLLARTKPAFDGQEPSANFAAARALWRLGRLLDKNEYLKEAERTLQAFAPAMEQMPRGQLNMIGLLGTWFQSGPDVAIIGAADAPETRALWQEVYHHYLPGSIWVGLDPEQPDAQEIVRRIPLLADRPALAGRSTAYVCRNRACQKPVTTPGELRKLLP